MAQRLRVLVALTEDLGSFPSTYMATHNHLELHFLEILRPLLVSRATRHVLGAQ